jgi:hypothetical protein
MKIKFLVFSLVLLHSSLSSGKVYEFKKLFQDLGYTAQTNYFNSTVDEITSIESYIDKYESYYSEINNYLRFHPGHYDWDGTSPEMARQNVKDIDHIMTRAPQIPGDIILFRGLTLKWRGDKPFELGEEYQDKAYISTTTTYSVAEYFAKGLSSDKNLSNKKALFALYFSQPKIKGLLIDQGEDEIILGHGKKFRIMDKIPLAEYDYYLVQVCAKICETQMKKKDVQDWWTQQKKITPSH